MIYVASVESWKKFSHCQIKFGGSWGLVSMCSLDNFNRGVPNILIILVLFLNNVEITLTYWKSWLIESVKLSWIRYLHGMKKRRFSEERYIARLESFPCLSMSWKALPDGRLYLCTRGHFISPHACMDTLIYWKNKTITTHQLPPAPSDPI